MSGCAVAGGAVDPFPFALPDLLLGGRRIIKKKKTIFVEERHGVGIGESRQVMEIGILPERILGVSRAECAGCRRKDSGRSAGELPEVAAARFEIDGVHAPMLRYRDDRAGKGESLSRAVVRAARAESNDARGALPDGADRGVPAGGGIRILAPRPASGAIRERPSLSRAGPAPSAAVLHQLSPRRRVARAVHGKQP